MWGKRLENAPVAGGKNTEAKGRRDQRVFRTTGMPPGIPNNGNAPGYSEQRECSRVFRTTGMLPGGCGAGLSDGGGNLLSELWQNIVGGI